MEPQTYFIRESPDYNFCLWGRPERAAANRVVLCIMTEFGLCNDRRMNIPEFSEFIENIQIVTGTLDENKEDIRDKHHRKKKSVVSTIESMRPNTPVGPAIGETPIENTA